MNQEQTKMLYETLRNIKIQFFTETQNLKQVELFLEQHLNPKKDIKENEKENI